jgi:hypothetical protein
MNSKMPKLSRSCQNYQQKGAEGYHRGMGESKSQFCAQGFHKRLGEESRK